MTTYLVTGAAGFIGSHLCDRLLDRGARVVGVDDLSTGSVANLLYAHEQSAFTFVECGLRSWQLRDVFDRHQPDVVMHLAAQSSVGVSVVNPVVDAETNIVGTIALLELCVAYQVRRFVYAASGGTLYGEVSRPARETDLIVPTSPYGISKAAVLDYLDHYARAGLDWVALALSNVYGPRQASEGEAGVVAAFARALLNGQAPTIHGDGEQTRDFVYVADVVDAFIAATTRGEGLINIGTGVETSINALHSAFGDLAYVPPTYAPPREGDLRRSVLDPTLAEQTLLWQPNVDLHGGIGFTLQHLRGAR